MERIKISDPISSEEEKKVMKLQKLAVIWDTIHVVDRGC